MKVFDRLNQWFSRPGVPAEAAEPPPSDILSLGSMAQEIEDCNWAALQDDIDRFSKSFAKRGNHAP